MPEQKTKSKPNFDQDLFNLLHDVKNPFKGDENPHFKSKFAGLASCLKTIKPALKENNFAIQQIVKQLESGGAVLQTNLIHISGKVVCDGGIPLVSKDANDPQKLGGSITYARRYGMCSILGIVGDDDDDANLASETDTKAVNELHNEFCSNIVGSKDLGMLKEVYETYKEEINKLEEKDKERFRKTYTEQLVNVKERKDKNADS